MKDEKKTIDKNGSLMKKTKAQLVEIILRKDEVESTLRKELERAENYASQKCIDYNILNDKYIKRMKELDEAICNENVIKEEYREQCDKHASERQELIDKINRYKTLFYLSLTSMLMLGIYIVL